MTLGEIYARSQIRAVTGDVHGVTRGVRTRAVTPPTKRGGFIIAALALSGLCGFSMASFSRPSLAAAEASAAVEAALELPQTHEGTQTVHRASRAAEWEGYSTNSWWSECVVGPH
jgi:hypothetical protein